MALTKQKTAEIVAKFGGNPQNTGSPEVQIALLTERITALQRHYATHKKDLLTRRNFLKLLGQRRALLKYLRKTDAERYARLIEQLGL